MKHFCLPILIVGLLVVLLGARSVAFAKTQKILIPNRSISLSDCDPKKVVDTKVKVALEAANAEVVKLPAVELPERGKVPINLKEYRCEISRTKDGAFEITFHNRDAEARIERKRKTGTEFFGGAGAAQVIVKDGKVVEAGLFQ